MQYCLIENLGPNFSLSKNCRLVALTHIAIYKLEKLGYDYVTFEDFYRSGEISGDTDAFLAKQLLWVPDFDEFIKSVFPEAKELDANLASIYLFWIKLLIDNVIMSARIIRRFLESTQPDKILFLTENPAPDLIDYILSFRNVESTFSRLIEPICEAEGIEFERLILEDGGGVGNGANVKIFHNRQNSAMELIKKVTPHRIFNLSKQVWDVFYGYIHIFKSGSLFGKGRGNIFVLNGLVFVQEFLGNGKRPHYKYFLNENGSIRKESLFGFRKIGDIDETLGASIGDSIDWAKVLHSLCNGQIMEWLNAQCGLDVSSVVVSRFEYFLREICPKVLSMMPVFINFYNKYDIDLVTIGHLTTPEEHAAVTAARYSRKTKSAYFLHGVDALEAKSRTVGVFRLFDLYFVSSKEEAENERKLLKECNLKLPEVFVSSHFQKRCLRRSKVKYPRKELLSYNQKPIVLFVPMVCTPWPSRFVEKGVPFPMEYVKWHCYLADLFSRRKEYHFIWNSLAIRDMKVDLMKEILKKEKYDNISFHSKKMMVWLPVAERVLCDIPSTAFFEAIYCKLPVMALFRPEDQELNKHCYARFEKNLRGYSSIDEGIKLVEEFLDNDAKQYVAPFEETMTSGVEILDSVLAE